MTTQQRETQHASTSHAKSAQATPARVNEQNTHYRSGAAARLSGVPVETLRVWERRYGVTNPVRSEQGQRQYSFEDVRRLGLIKQLVDAGNAISAVAKLSLDELLEMQHSAVAAGVSSSYAGMLEQKTLRIALVGAHLRHGLISRGEESAQMILVQTANNLHQAPQQLKDVVVDVLVIELGEIAEPEEQLQLIRTAQQACSARAVLVLYRFASSDAIRRLRLAGNQVARIPGDAGEVASLCRVALARSQVQVRARQRRATSMPRPRPQYAAQEIPARLMDEDMLAVIARSATSIHCECPRHLVDLLQTLWSFEQYSAQCENRNADDAALHRDLHYTAAQARASLEQALLRVAEAEGIKFLN
ncbi:MerR family transcriptional regulator [Undibacterium cyanobacteriorum]|uniref:MerR family transcriptional regulator n=1 Tax=Undibacterium cyanobacteriorum TaxID=3073561 RepID=A0ABY9RG78_9BURK|nr:MerR family transcriptional regulator [Undibacterium sp. 20NA77.5]WMW79242.1 MerR family transcriptional regulator [Undibacterium sp. 20NA77.5]